MPRKRRPTIKEQAISAAAVAQLILLRDAVVGSDPRQMVEPARGPLTAEERPYLEAAEAQILELFDMKVPPPRETTTYENYARHWAELCERLDLGDPTGVRLSPEALRSLCLAILKNPVQQPLAQSLLVVVAEALLRHLLFPGGEAITHFRPDMRKIIGGLAQALIEHRGIEPGQAYKKVRALLNNQLSEDAIRKHREHYLEDLRTASERHRTQTT
jgi:hypothetical protein